MAPGAPRLSTPPPALLHPRSGPSPPHLPPPLADDEKRVHWYTHTAFAELWRSLTVKNPMFTSLALNGGAVFAFICFARLWEERKARKAAATSGKKKR